MLHFSWLSLMKFNLSCGLVTGLPQASGTGFPSQHSLPFVTSCALLLVDLKN